MHNYDATAKQQKKTLWVHSRGENDVAFAQPGNHILFLYLSSSKLILSTKSQCLYCHSCVSACLNSVLFFYLQVEENSTEDKLKDGAPLDSQSEGTNYFLQYISTPRWRSVLLIWLYVTINNSSYFCIIYLFSAAALSVQKMPQTVQPVRPSLFLGRICLNVFW